MLTIWSASKGKIVGINFELFRKMLRLHKEATQGAWFVSPEYEDDTENKCVSIGGHAGEHYEGTIAQFFGGEHDHIANATFVAYVASHVGDMCVEIEKMKKLVDGMEKAAIHDDFSKLRNLFGEINAEKGFKVIKPRSPDQRHPGGNKRLFLAGSIDMGQAEDWQFQVEEKIKNLPVTVYNPRRDDWNPDLRQDISEPEFAYQVNWELDNIDAADVIFVYFSPGGPAPITLMELGTMVSSKAKIVVCCPEGYWRRGNVQILCHRYSIPFFNDLPDAIDVLTNTLRR